MVSYLYNNDDLMFVVELLHEVLTSYRVTICFVFSTDSLGDQFTK